MMAFINKELGSFLKAFIRSHQTVKQDKVVAEIGIRLFMQEKVVLAVLSSLVKASSYFSYDPGVPASLSSCN